VHDEGNAHAGKTKPGRVLKEAALWKSMEKLDYEERKIVAMTLIETQSE